MTNFSLIFLNAILYTPIWVWCILGYLIFIGIKSSRTRIIYPPTLLILPAVFVLINYRIFKTPFTLTYYISFLSLGSVIGFTIGQSVGLRILKHKKRIELPGSYSTLIILLIFFSFKYTFGFWSAVQPGLAEQYAFIEISVSGMLSGYFLGKSACYLHRYYTA